MPSEVIHRNSGNVAAPDGADVPVSGRYCVLLVAAWLLFLGLVFWWFLHFKGA